MFQGVSSYLTYYFLSNGQEPFNPAFILMFSKNVYYHSTRLSIQVCHCAGGLLIEYSFSNIDQVL